MAPAVERPGAPAGEVTASPVPAAGAGVGAAPAATSGLTAGPVTAAPTTVVGAPALEALAPAAERLLVPIAEAIAGTVPRTASGTTGRRLTQVGGSSLSGPGLPVMQAAQKQPVSVRTLQPRSRVLVVQGSSGVMLPPSLALCRCRAAAAAEAVAVAVARRPEHALVRPLPLLSRLHAVLRLRPRCVGQPVSLGAAWLAASWQCVEDRRWQHWRAGSTGMCVHTQLCKRSSSCAGLKFKPCLPSTCAPLARSFARPCLMRLLCTSAETASRKRLAVRPRLLRARQRLPRAALLARCGAHGPRGAAQLWCTCWGHACCAQESRSKCKSLAAKQCTCAGSQALPQAPVAEAASLLVPVAEAVVRAAPSAEAARRAPAAKVCNRGAV